jgi:hypothetical protein
MKFVNDLCQFISEIPSGPEREISSNGDHSADPSRLEHVMLIGLRSPGDQLQVVAIRSWHADGLRQSDQLR